MLTTPIRSADTGSGVDSTGGLPHRGVGPQDVHSPIGQAGPQCVEWNVLHGDPGPGEGPSNRGGDRCHPHSLKDWFGVGRESESNRQPLLAAPRGSPYRVGVRQQRHHFYRKPHTGRGEMRNPRRAALDQHHTQLTLKMLNLFSQRRRTEVQPYGGPLKMTFLGQHDEARGQTQVKVHTQLRTVTPDYGL